MYHAHVFDCRHRPLALPDPLVAELAVAYGEPHRMYHNVTHIAELLRHFDEVTWRQPAEVYVAIVFHDAIYLPGAKDNEARSAAWARRAGLPVDGDRVAELILATARHGAIDHAGGDDALFLDCDMAILGAPPAEFDAYDAAIALEYRHVPPAAYAAGRRAFLAQLLAKPRIFLSDFFHLRLDAAARQNLARRLAA